MHRLRTLGLATVASLAFIAVPAQAVGPADVTVRVEGDADTLVARAAVRTTTTPVVKDGNPAHACTGTSAAGALEQSTAGAWSGPWSDSFGGAYTVAAIRGESHAFGSGRYWSIFVNDVPASFGVCGLELQDGDALLFAPVPESGTPPNPLVLAGVPARATPGQALTVTVTRVVTTFDPVTYVPSTVREPVAGATVAGAASATTGADGRAQVTIDQRGAGTLRATKAGEIRSSSEALCVTDGADGSCGTTAAGAPELAVAAAVCQTAGDDGLCGTADRRAALAKILSISERQRFGRGRGPRTLRGSVAGDPSGLRDVRLRLTRTDAGRCQTFDARRERFVALARCGAARGRWFSVGDRADWTYLLPRALTRGRYVLDVETRDGAGNRDTLLQRTRNRVVFFVG